MYLLVLVTMLAVYILIGLGNHVGTLCWRDACVLCVMHGRGFVWSCLSHVPPVGVLSVGRHSAHSAAAQESGQAVGL